MEPKWSPQQTEKLRELWPVMSATQIATILPFSRSAISGKANRLGLVKRIRQPLKFTGHTHSTETRQRIGEGVALAARNRRYIRTRKVTWLVRCGDTVIA